MISELSEKDFRIILKEVHKNYKKQTTKWNYVNNAWKSISIKKLTYQKTTKKTHRNPRAEKYNHSAEKFQ